MSEKLSADVAVRGIEMAALVFFIESVSDVPDDVMERVVILREKLIGDLDGAEMSAEDLFNYLFDKYGV